MAPTDLRAIFDEDPELYDRARPGYPATVFSDLSRRADIRPGSQVLEIGPGTGQATAGLVALGASVTGVELGAGLADVLRRRLAGAPVRVVVSTFEDWSPPEAGFDAVVAFTSWHWLDPAVRVAKVAAVLRPGGTLATVTTTHVAGGTTDFFRRAQDCYLRWDPGTPTGQLLLSADEIPPARDEVDGSELFEPATRLRYEQDVSYTTTEYLELLATYSGHRALAPELRRGLLDGIGTLLDDRFGGAVTKRYLYELRLARRAPAAASVGPSGDPPAP